MIERSFDPVVMSKAFEPYPSLTPNAFDWKAWLDNHDNIMLVEGDSIGLLTYEYEGVYNPHYFLKERGRAALDLTKRMIAQAFRDYDVKVMRGITPADNKAARWAARQVGCTSHGLVSAPEGDYEIFILTKDSFDGT